MQSPTTTLSSNVFPDLPEVLRIVLEPIPNHFDISSVEAVNPALPRISDAVVAHNVTFGHIVANLRRRPPQPDTALVSDDFVGLDGIVTPVFDGYAISPVRHDAIVPQRRSSRIAQPKAVVGERRDIGLKNIALRERGLESVVGRKAAVVSSDVIIVAGVSIIGSDKEPIASISQAVANDPITMGKFLQQDARRVRCVVPESPGEPDAVIGAVVLNDIIAGSQQVYADIAAVRKVVSSDGHRFASNQINAVEVVVCSVPFDEALRDS
jgi:hypothetical protein